MKLFIDANVYLDFYRSNNDAIKIFDELIKNSKFIVLTEQIIEEFFRNREVVLNEIKKKFSIDSALENFTSAFLNNMPEFSELSGLRKSYYNKRSEIEKKINEIIENPKIDPVSEHFNSLINSKDVVVIKTTPEIINLAHQRKLKGNPPVSDKFTIGDEINWEALIGNVKDDIIIVARDNTYVNNINFLKRDYLKSTGKNISSLVDKITSGLGLIGQKQDDKLIRLEQTQINSLFTYKSNWMVLNVRGNIADVTDGKGRFGYTVLDESIADPSYRCAFCGNFGPWNGTRCLSCGQMSDD